ncbi:unnamed protein product [Clonostachys byssicola]|uniref:Rhodopsin domain-containing protein n=1 Tax=Clonostachys byssicola TaxID=160290 RepID=A0A9N9U889_9HYPO|nr:unnamed protein product [Clonostachys byssicola]
MSATSPSPAVTHTTFTGVGISLTALAGIAVALRCFVNYRTSYHKLAADDYLAVVGLCFSIITYGINDHFLNLISVPPQSIDLIALQKLSVAVIIFVQGTLWFSKAPIVFLYLKLFGVNRWLRYISWVTLVISGMVYTGGLIYTLVHCPVNPSKATFPEYQKCATANTLAGVISGCISVTVDAILFFLPIPVIIRLNLKLSQKIGLSLTFFSAILGIAASAISLYYKLIAYLYGNGTEFIVPILCFTLEALVAIMVGCAPGLRSFWIVFISKTSTSGKSKQSSYDYRHGSSKNSSNRQRALGFEGSYEHINPEGENSGIQLQTLPGK